MLSHVRRERFSVITLPDVENKRSGAAEVVGIASTCLARTPNQEKRCTAPQRHSSRGFLSLGNETMWVCNILISLSAISALDPVDQEECSHGWGLAYDRIEKRGRDLFLKRLICSRLVRLQLLWKYTQSKAARDFLGMLCVLKSVVPHPEAFDVCRRATAVDFLPQPLGRRYHQEENRHVRVLWSKVD